MRRGASSTLSASPSPPVGTSERTGAERSTIGAVSDTWSAAISTPEPVVSTQDSTDSSASRSASGRDLLICFRYGATILERKVPSSAVGFAVSLSLALPLQLTKKGCSMAGAWGARRRWRGVSDVIVHIKLVPYHVYYVINILVLYVCTFSSNQVSYHYR